MPRPSISDPISRTVYRNPGLFFAEAVAMIVLGALALILPTFMSFAFTILLGWLLSAGGAFSLISTLLNRHGPGFWWSLASSLISVIVGIVFFVWPFSGLVSLTLALAGFLLLDGILSILMAFEHRRHLTPRWSMLLVSGLASVLFSIVITMLLPQISLWWLGTVIGIDLLISGAALAAITFDAVYA